MSPNNSISTKEICYHCGDICNEKQIHIEDKSFCCTGCKSVYEILNQNSLCNYYTLEQNPGVSPKHINSENFNYLEDIDLESKLLDFKDDKISKVSFLLPQMHCASCIWLLEKLFKLNPSIKQSRVDFPKKVIYITFDHQKLSLKDLIILLSSIGYEPHLSFADIHSKSKKTNHKTLYYQIGIAGFCFGNIMLLSLPEYFDLGMDLSTSFKGYFALINLILALPVLFYSDLDYLKSAFASLKSRTINIDVPLSLGMIALFAISLFEILSKSGPGYLDSFTGLVFFLLIGKAFQKKTFDSISFERDYKSYFPIYATLIRDGKKLSISLEKLLIGDRIEIKNNELIPADGILLKGNAIIDYSFVTGETDPVFKVLGEIIYAGGKQIGTSIEIETIKDVSNSYLTSLWNQSDFSDEDKNDLDKISNKVSKWFTIAIILIASISSLFYFPDFSSAVKVFTAVLIVACPCALALSIPYTFGNVIRILGLNGFYLKNSSIVENLAKSDHIVFDKTGTLTNSNSWDLEYVGQALNQEELSYVKTLSSQSNHPYSKKIYNHINSDVLEIQNFNEIIGLGLKAEIDQHKVMLGSSKFFETQSEDGIHLKIDDAYKGRFIIQNKLRSESAPQLSALSKDYHMSICSGDSSKDLQLMQSLIPDGSEILFNQKPIEKLEYINSLKAKGKKVIMIGDGLNDAGALKASFVGISLADNTGHFSPASDVIMDSKVFKSLDKILGFSRYSIKIVYASFILSALYNCIGLAFAVQGMLTPVLAAILMPLSSISVVAFATISTNLKARNIGLV